jgi:hypothetical protein
VRELKHSITADHNADTRINREHATGTHGHV